MHISLSKRRHGTYSLYESLSLRALPLKDCYIIGCSRMSHYAPALVLDSGAIDSSGAFYGTEPLTYYPQSTYWRVLIR